jgi:hypothetical protein
MTTRLDPEAVSDFLRALGELSQRTGIVLRGDSAYLPWLEPVTENVARPIAYRSLPVGRYLHPFVSVVLPTDRCAQCEKLWHEGPCKETEGG